MPGWERSWSKPDTLVCGSTLTIVRCSCNSSAMWVTSSLPWKPGLSLGWFSLCKLVSSSEQPFQANIKAPWRTHGKLRIRIYFVLKRACLCLVSHYSFYGVLRGVQDKRISARLLKKKSVSIKEWLSVFSKDGRDCSAGPIRFSASQPSYPPTHLEVELIFPAPTTWVGPVNALSSRAWQEGCCARFKCKLWLSGSFHLSAHRRPVSTKEVSLPKAAKPQEEAVGDKTPHGEEKEIKEEQGTRQMGEEVLLQVGPPAPAATT